MTELYSQRRSDGAQIRITVKHVQELAPNNPELLRIFKKLWRRPRQRPAELELHCKTVLIVKEGKERKERKPNKQTNKQSTRSWRVPFGSVAGVQRTLPQMANKDGTNEGAKKVRLKLN